MDARFRGRVLALIELLIHGQPYSKANSRRVVKIDGKVRVIKSAEALSYAASAALQARAQMRGAAPLEGRLFASIEMFYRDERADLDESALLDALQGIAYVNDRQVRERLTVHRIDKTSPRTSIRLTLTPPAPNVVKRHNDLDARARALEKIAKETQMTLAETFPPGEFIKEELAARHWRRAKLAEMIGCPVKAVDELIRGSREITPETAALLGNALGTGAEFWMNLESQYRLFKGSCVKPR